MKPVPLIMACLVLSGCIFENEEACYEKLRADFQSDIDFGFSDECAVGGRRDSCLDYVSAANTSKASIFLIYMDDDQNACDYYSDGPRLRRK